MYCKDDPAAGRISLQNISSIAPGMILISGHTRGIVSASTDPPAVSCSGDNNALANNMPVTVFSGKPHLFRNMLLIVYVLYV